MGGVSGEEFYLLSRFDFVNLLLRGQSSTYFYNLKPNIFCLQVPSSPGGADVRCQSGYSGCVV